MKYKLLSLLLPVMMFGFALFGANTMSVFAADGDCFNLEKSSIPLISANLNEGMLDFSNNTLLSRYRGCVQAQEEYGQNEYVLKGWVWNTNLGWISLGSFTNATASKFSGLPEYKTGVGPAGAKLNREIASGNIAYSSVAQVLSRNAAGVNGELFGYWWGDNVGWIRLNCAKYYDTDASYCGSSNHKVSFNSANKAANGYYLLNGYAWSDSVGWINMSGVEVDLDAATKTFSDIKMEVRSQSVNVKADGVDGYRLQLAFFDVDNNNITADFYSYINGVNSDANINNNVSVCLLANDNRKLDKVTENANNTVLGQMSNCGEQAFTRFGSNINDFTILPGQAAKFNLVDNVLVSNQILKSTVPSDAGDFELDRVLLRIGNAELVKNLDRVLPLNFLAPFNVKLVLDGRDLAAADCLSSFNDVFRMSLGVPVSMNLCGTFGPVSGASNPRVTLQFNKDIPDLDLHFDKITTQEGEVVVSDYIPGTEKLAGQVDNSQTYSPIKPIVPVSEPEPKAKAKEPVAPVNPLGLPKAGLPVLGGEAEAPVLRNEVTGSVIAEEPVIVDLGDNPVFSFSNVAPAFRSNPFRAVVTIDPESEVDSADLNRWSQEILSLGVRTVLEYTIGANARVKRYGPSLDQAFFRIDKVGGTGTFTDRAFTQVSSSGASVGAETRTGIRDHFIKGVFESIANGIKPSCSSNLNDPLRITTNFIANCETSAKSKIYYVANQKNERWLLPYDRIRTLFDAVEDNPKTLVLTGIDVYFDSNVLNDATQYPSLVLLSNKNGRGGNVYIGAEVTELKGYIFADKSFYSVENSTAARNENVNAKGVPINYMQRDFDKFYSQIAFVGRFFGQNCFGCALSSPAYKGDGTKAANVEEAQPYDFNYFRFSSLTYKTVIANVFGADRQVYVDCAGNSTFEIFNPDNDPNYQISKNYLCWLPRESLVSQGLIKAAPLLDAQRAADRDESETKAVNFLYKAPRGLPLFSGF